MHPYKDMPARQFWASAVQRGFDARAVCDASTPLIRRTDAVVSAGSCFAANLVPFLEGAGFRYLRTEDTAPAFLDASPENLGYEKYSAGYGNVYTARQLRQLLARCLGRFQPVEDRWIINGSFIDPFRPGLHSPARCEQEFAALTAEHLNAVKRAFSECDVLIFTLGLTEAWVSRADGVVFPVCPGTIAGSFDSGKHAFVNFDVDDVADDLRRFVAELREINPKARLVLSVSPVPLVATASGGHVVTANAYSKSTLRVAAQTVCDEIDNVFYFPAYEIVTGPQAPRSFFEEDRRNLSEEAVRMVMEAFLAACEPSADPSRQIEFPSSAPADTLAFAPDGDRDEAEPDR